MLYAVYWVLSLFPWVLWKLIVVVTSTVGQLVFLIICAVLFAGAIVALNNAGRKTLVGAMTARCKFSNSGTGSSDGCAGCSSGG